MDRSVLARKPMTELKDIASHLQMRGFQKLRKADLIDAIITHATGEAGSNGSTADADSAGDGSGDGRADDGRAGDSRGEGGARARTRTRTRERSAGDDQAADTDGQTAAQREETARKVLPPAERDRGSDDDAGSSGRDASAGRSRSRSAKSGTDDGSSGGRSNRERNDKGAHGAAKADADSSGDATAPEAKASNGSKGSNGSKKSSGGSKDDTDASGQAAKASASAENDADADGDGEESASSRKRRNRRDRRKRNRERNEQDGQQENQPGEVRAGVLDILPEGYGFLRTTGYLPGDRDVYVSQGQIRKHDLRRGDVVQGPIRQQRNNEKVPALHHVQKVNGDELVANKVAERPDYDELVAVYPSEPLRLETPKGSTVLRVIDLLAPVGRGQRALLVAPPAAGRTDTMTGIGQAIAENNPDVHLMVLLIDERPEDVTEVQRALPAEVIASTFSRPVEDHAQIAELALERAKRMVELGHDVVILLDSLTRLARAYGGGGVDASSLFPAKRFFGAARNIEDGGSLTIVAATLVDTGSTTDQVIHDEFLGTANAVITLQGDLEPHLRPAIDVAGSTTRRDELMVEGEDLQALWALRRRMETLPPAEAARTLADQVAATADNRAFLNDLQKVDGS